MRKHLILTGVIALFFCVSGCETAKGLKKDVQNTWHNAQGVDDWFQENLW